MIKGIYFKKYAIFYSGVIVLLLTTFNKVSAQESDPFKPELNKSMLPQSPNAAAFMKAVLFPVTLYNGVPNVSFPIYEVKNGPLSVGISLSYNYNGFRPKEEASWVGLGWNLNVGGVITRIIKGELDDDPFLPNKRFDKVANQHMYGLSQDYMTEIGLHLRDGEPDLYVFNFNGYSGKFIIKNGKAFLFPHQDLQITFIGGNFTIITEDGTKYLFDDREMNRPKQLAPDDPDIPLHTSAWYLTKIIAQDQVHVIDFNYTTAVYRDRSPKYSETFQRKWPHGALNPIDNISSSPSPPSEITTKVLSSIITRNTEVHFLPGDLRDDINYNEFNSHRTLAAIKVTSIVYGLHKVVKNYGFNYEYFAELNGSWKKLRLKNFTTRDVQDLVLETHQFEYSGQSNYIPASSAITKGIDHWGFYNGQEGNLNLAPTGMVSSPVSWLATANRDPNTSASSYGILTKVIYPTGGNTEFIYQQNKYNNGLNYVYEPRQQSLFCHYGGSGVTSTTINFSISEEQDVTVTYNRVIPGFNEMEGLKEFGKIARIESIDDLPPVIWEDPSPYMDHELSRVKTVHLRAGDYRLIMYCRSHATNTYGVVNYTWRSDDVIEGADGPGLRIASMKMTDNVTGKTITKKYEYKNDDGTSSGKLMVLPMYPGKESVYYCGGYATCPCGVQIKKDMIYSHSLDYKSSLTGLTDLDFYYKKVTELSEGENGENQKSVYTYDLPSLDNLTGVDLISEYKYKQSGTTYQLLASTTYTYDYFTKGLVNCMKANLYISGTCVPVRYAMSQLGYDFFSTSTTYPDIRNRYKHYIPDSYFLHSMWKKVSNKTDYIYDPATSSFLKTSIDYSYTNPNHTLATKEKQVNSKGEEVIIDHIYPLDMSLNSCTSIQTIESNHSANLTTVNDNYSTAITNRYNNCLSVVSQFLNGQGNYDVALACYTNSVCDENSFTAFDQTLQQYFTAIETRKSCFESAFASATPMKNKAALLMQIGHNIGTEIERVKSIKKAGLEMTTAAVKTDFTIVNGNAVVPETIFVSKLTQPTEKTSFLANPNSYYDPAISFTHNSDVNMVSQKKVNDVSESYIWGHNKNLVIASVINASPSQIAFTGFEDGDYGTWNYIGGTMNDEGKTLNTSFEGTLIKTFPTGDYTVTAWAKAVGGTARVNEQYGTLKQTINGWNQYEWNLSNESVVAIDGIYLDEVRLFPKGAQMTTYTYRPLLGLLGQADINNKFMKYEYDSFGRLKVIYDQDGNILKTFDYKYQEQQ